MGSVSKLRDMTDIVTQAFVTNTLPGGGTFTGIPNRTSSDNIGLNIFPNPARDKINIKLLNRDENHAVHIEQSIKELTSIPSIGKSIAHDLWNIGIIHNIGNIIANISFEGSNFEPKFFTACLKASRSRIAHNEFMVSAE